jgi:hypothetical protein
MERIINHWTAGTYKPNATDKSHYHILIDGDGNEVAGDHPISANEKPKGNNYAAHTLNCNSGSIGVSCCSMAGAVESPLDYGKCPLTEAQWAKLIEVNARLCKQYGIPVTPKTVLSHAEVQANLGIRQRNKWDISHLKFRPDLVGAKAVGDELRKQVAKRVGKVKDPNVVPASFISETKPVLQHKRVWATITGFVSGGGAASLASFDGFDWRSLAVMFGGFAFVVVVFCLIYRQEIRDGLFGPRAK